MEVINYKAGAYVIGGEITADRLLEIVKEFVNEPFIYDTKEWRTKLINNKSRRFFTHDSSKSVIEIVEIDGPSYKSHQFVLHGSKLPFGRHTKFEEFLMKNKIDAVIVPEDGPTLYIENGKLAIDSNNQFALSPFQLIRD